MTSKVRAFSLVFLTTGSFLNIRKHSQITRRLLPLMGKTPVKALSLLALFCSLIGHQATARLSEAWDFEKLQSQADFVGIIHPVSNERATDVFTIDRGNGKKIVYDGLNTRFKIEVVLKTDNKASQEVVVLHFSDEHAQQIANGPIFVFFPVEPARYQRKLLLLKNGAEVGKASESTNNISFLAFLKRRSDGRYEPVAGQEDCDSSFYEIYPAFFPMP